MITKKSNNINNPSPTKYNSSNGDEENFSVYVRIRPLNNREMALSNGKRRSKIIKKQENMSSIYRFLEFERKVLSRTYGFGAT